MWCPLGQEKRRLGGMGQEDQTSTSQAAPFLTRQNCYCFSGAWLFVYNWWPVACHHPQCCGGYFAVWWGCFGLRHVSFCFRISPWGECSQAVRHIPSGKFEGGGEGFLGKKASWLIKIFAGERLQKIIFSRMSTEWGYSGLFSGTGVWLFNFKGRPEIFSANHWNFFWKIPSDGLVWWEGCGSLGRGLSGGLKRKSVLESPRQNSHFLAFWPSLRMACHFWRANFAAESSPPPSLGGGMGDILCQKKVTWITNASVKQCGKEPVLLFCILCKWPGTPSRKRDFICFCIPCSSQAPFQCHWWGCSHTTCPI